MGEEAQDQSWVKDLSHETFQACLAFYDKNPVIGSIGFLVLLSTLPLVVILRYLTNMRRVDNELVVNKYRLELEASAKKMKGKGKSSKAAAPAASTTTTAGG